MKQFTSHTFRELAIGCCLVALGIAFGCSNGPEPGTNENQPAKPSMPVADAAMLDAAAKGNNERVQELLDKGVSVNMQGGDHNTPIMEAAYAGHLDTVKLLLNHGADLSAKKTDGATPIGLAGGHKDIADLFKDVSSLIAAAGKGDNQALKSLIDKGTPVNGLDQFGHTALTEAVWNGFAETVKLLLDKGADPTIKKSDGETPLNLANGKKNQTIIDLLNQAISKRGSAATPAK